MNDDERKAYLIQALSRMQMNSMSLIDFFDMLEKNKSVSNLNLHNQNLNHAAAWQIYKDVIDLLHEIKLS